MSSNKDDNKSESTSTNNSVPTKSETADDNTIAIKNLKFGSGTITVKKGTKVTWKNEDSMDHTVTSEDDGPLNSGSLSKGASYSMTFDEIGTFDYSCDFHSGMSGTVIVTE